MGPKNNSEELTAHAAHQVDAFLRVLQERMDIDEEKIRRIIYATQKNGKTYITWAWVITILLALVSFLGIRFIDTIEKRLELIEGKQADVRERLRELEGVVRRWPIQP
jgi:hypothetical protein